MTYSVREIFYTIQGEGAHAGSAAVFVRFSGCNVWSGREEDRTENSKRGNCALWCDTEFRGTGGVNGGRYTAEQIAAIVRSLWPGTSRATAILTGGEPLLQVDDALVAALHAADIAVHVETNGSRIAPSGIDWVTVSPKPPLRVVEQRFDEVKLVLAPDVDPAQFVELAPRRYLQPLWLTDEVARQANVARTVAYVMQDPRWRVSIQTHKVIGIP